MNTAEKIAATYLRLNGFLLLPHFTVLAGGQHGHVDLVGLRAACSAEVSRDVTFPVDAKFFDVVGESDAYQDPRDRFLGVVAEVRTNIKVIHPDLADLDYVQKFLGGVPIVPVAFSDSAEGPSWSKGSVEIGNMYALDWIIDRIEWIENHHEPLKKTGSWTWSEDALADLLVLHQYGALRHGGGAR
jgi:hypothetical protein